MSEIKEHRADEEENEVTEVDEEKKEEKGPSGTIDDSSRAYDAKKTDEGEIKATERTEVKKKEEQQEEKKEEEEEEKKKEEKEEEKKEEESKDKVGNDKSPASKAGETKAEAVTEAKSSGNGGKEGRRSVIVGSEFAGVGEWNSLPILVERLRSALDRIDPPTISSQPAILEDSGIDSEEDLRIRNSMERGCNLVECSPPVNETPDTHDNDIKRNLEVLGSDLPFQDVRTALNRLRDTLDRIDLTAITANDSATISDNTDQSHLVHLVSALLNRLDASAAASTNVSGTSNNNNNTTNIARRNPLPAKRRRNSSRHTIAITVEELTRARKCLEEEEDHSMNEDERVKDAGPSFARSTKDALQAMHRNVLKTNTDTVDILPILPPQLPLSISLPTSSISSPPTSSFMMTNLRDQRRSSYDENNDRKVPFLQQSSDTSTTRDQALMNVSTGTPTGLLSVVRQRAADAESMQTSNGRFASNGKMSAKKAKMKRANTIDIPSYLAMQGENVGNGGCLPLRRPIGVADKLPFGQFAGTNPAIPSFRPKTENDRKFLALINRNNELPSSTVPPVFASSGFSKSFLNSRAPADVNWNSRFSNIKTAFDKPSSNEPQQPGFRRTGKPADVVPHHGFRRFEQQENHLPSNQSAAFRHAPSSLFRKIEKPLPPPKPTPINSTDQSWNNQPRNSMYQLPTPGNTLRERARMMFDRENKSCQWKRNDETVRSSDAHPTSSSFPRPPWIERERQPVPVENGKIDYRSFCKQFAPFVNRTNAVGTVKPVKRIYEEEKRRIVDESPGKINNPIISKDQTNDARIRSDASVQTEINEKQTVSVDDCVAPASSSISPKISNGQEVYLPEELVAEDLNINDEISNVGIPNYDIPPLVDDRNIANQDFGPEIGLVTRYSSAIVTVAPTPEKVAIVYRSGATTAEEEIKRHNDLQRNLLQQLRHEREPSPPRHHVNQIPIRVDFTPSEIPANRVTTLRDVYEQPKNRSSYPNGTSVNTVPIDSSDEYLVTCANNRSNRSIVLAKSESWHQLALSDRSPKPPVISNVPSGTPHSCRPPKPKSPSSAKLRSHKQYEASSTSDNVKRMEEKIRRYFKDNSSDDGNGNVDKDCSRKKRSNQSTGGLSRSRTMPGICQDGLAASLLAPPPFNLSPLDAPTDFDKAFDDIFEEATRNNHQQQKQHQHY